MAKLGPIVGLKLFLAEALVLVWILASLSLGCHVNVVVSVALLLALVLAIPIAGLRPLDHLSSAFRWITSRSPGSPSADIQIADYAPAQDEPVGMYWDGETVMAAIRLRPHTSPSIDVARLSTLLTQIDITLSSISLLLSSVRHTGSHWLTAEYATQIGFTAAAVESDCIVALRLDPHANLTPVQSRGSVEKCIAIAARRVQHHLANSGIEASILTGIELADLRQSSFGAATLEAHSFSYRTSFLDGVRSTSFAVHAKGLTPARLQSLSRVPHESLHIAVHVTGARSTSCTAGSANVTAVARIAHRFPLPMKLLRQLYLTHLPGQQREAFIATTPSPVPEIRLAGFSSAALDKLDLRCPGIVFGRDGSGLPAAIPIFDRQALHIEFSADLTGAAFLLARIVATGKRILVVSVRAHEWKPMVERLSDVARLAVTDKAPPILDVDVLVFDGQPVSPHPARIRVIRLHPDGTDLRPDRRTVAITQNIRKRDTFGAMYPGLAAPLIFEMTPTNAERVVVGV